MQKMTLLCSAVTVSAFMISSSSGTIHASHEGSTAWSMAVAVTEVNSAASDGCPIESRDGLSPAWRQPLEIDEGVGEKTCQRNDECDVT